MVVCFLSDLLSKRKARYESLSLMEGLNRYQTEENAVLLDVRTPEEFSEGHIPSAVNLSHEKVEKEISSLIPDKDTAVYIYCKSGVRAKKAAESMAKQGYTKIKEIGGILDYTGRIEK